MPKKKEKMDSKQQIEGQQGFTLIEVMMAMVILGIGLFSIAALQVHNMNYNSSSKRQTEGYNWAMDQVENILSLKYTPTPTTTDDGLKNKGNPVAPVVGAGHSVSQGPYTVEWYVHDNDGTLGLPSLPGSKRIHVAVRWNNKQVAQVNYTRTLTSF